MTTNKYTNCIDYLEMSITAFKADNFIEGWQNIARALASINAIPNAFARTLRRFSTQAVLNAEGEKQYIAAFQNDTEVLR